MNLPKKSVLFAIPAYDRRLMDPVAAQILAARGMLGQGTKEYGPIYSDTICVAGSHIDRVRNTLSWLMLNNKGLPMPGMQWDTMVMIDTDITVDPGRLTHNILLNLDWPNEFGFIGLPCPLKTVPAKPNYKGKLVEYPKSQRQPLTEKDYYSVERTDGDYIGAGIGSGCVIISRNVLDNVRNYCEKHKLDYASDSPDPVMFGQRMWNMWKSGVHGKDGFFVEDQNEGCTWQDRQWNSEDYGFCQLLENLGIPRIVDMHPAARCTHWGIYPYTLPKDE